MSLLKTDNQEKEVLHWCKGIDSKCSWVCENKCWWNIPENIKNIITITKEYLDFLSSWVDSNEINPHNIIIGKLKELKLLFHSKWIVISPNFRHFLIEHISSIMVWSDVIRWEISKEHIDEKISDVEWEMRSFVMCFVLLKNNTFDKSIQEVLNNMLIEDKKWPSTWFKLLVEVLNKYKV